MGDGSHGREGACGGTSDGDWGEKKEGRVGEKDNVCSTNTVQPILCYLQYCKQMIHVHALTKWNPSIECVITLGTCSLVPRPATFSVARRKVIFRATENGAGLGTRLVEPLYRMCDHLGDLMKCPV